MQGGLIAAWAVLYIIIFFFGAVIASFLNVVIYRLPRGESFVKGRSHCTTCGHMLGPADMAPVFSYLILKGRCRYCKEPFSPRYAIVEGIGGAAAVLLFAVYGLEPVTLAAFGVAAGLILVTFIDIDTMTIPNSVVLYMMIPAVFLVFLLPDTPVLSHIIGFFAISVPVLLITLIIPGAFGGGDIKLFAVCGLALGWRLSLVMLFIALILGAVYGVYLLSVKKLNKREHMVFGPFIAVGAFAALLIGQPIVDWYAGLL